MDITTPLEKAGTKYRLYASRLKNLEIFTIEDLLFHLPYRYEDLSTISKIKDVQPGETVTIQGEITNMKNTYTRKKGFTIQNATVEDDTGKISCTWFNQLYILRFLKEGTRVSISGIAETPKKISVKDYEILNGQKSLHTGRLVPVYPATKNVSPKWIRGRIAELLPLMKSVKDYVPEVIKNEYGLRDLPQALKMVHFPQTKKEAEEGRRRLAFDELLTMQLAAEKQKREWKKEQKTTPFKVQEYQKEIENFFAHLPFELTHAQKRAVEDVFQDLGSTTPMNRLLQGDVGSGKTVVAAITMYLAHLNGFQSALMAPTEILANQHYQTITKLLEPFNLKISLFTSNIKEKDRKKDFNIAIGTHALLHKSITFEKLGLITIDEQQRFGVEQRAILREKGRTPHFLTMTATPIPRTVFLTMYGELSYSYLDELPKGRKRIKTWVVPNTKREAAYSWIGDQIDKGGEEGKSNQVFIICPFIEESETMSTVKAATKEYENLKSGPFKKYRVGLLHGKMKAKEKEEILKSFQDKKLDMLVTTPVVEVGIDIPDATIMLIEGADRFGLAQLHQLRGRVGRNDRQSYCLIFTENENATSRLKYLETMYLGADLAEVDLKIRGAGQMYGTQQSGRHNFKIADISDAKLLNNSQQAAQKLLNDIEKNTLLQDKLKSTIIRKISRD